LPTHFGHGLICNALYPWLGGQELHVVSPFRPDVLMQLGAIVDSCDITFLSSVPAMWRLIVRTSRPPRHPRLERVFCGSAPLSARLWAGIQAWAGTRDVWNVYGMTETASWMVGTSGAHVDPEDGLVGEPWGGAVRVVDFAAAAAPPLLVEDCAPSHHGAVLVRTPAMMKGYLHSDHLTAEAVAHGWLQTGDIGFLDERGQLHLSGRVRDEINKGGMKIHPAEVDAVVERFARAVDVCAFGYEDPLHGEDIGLAVVLDRDDEGTRQELYEWTRRHLAPHRMPQRWYVLSEIPRTVHGKVDRADVARRCAQRPALDLKSAARPPSSHARE
jgi:acyl-CoA synthetase (AMP-forming)/AMP-acid ligase II